MYWASFGLCLCHAQFCSSALLFFLGELVLVSQSRSYATCPLSMAIHLDLFSRISIASAQWEAASHVVGHSTKVDHKPMTGRSYFGIWGPSFMEILCVPELVLNRLWLFGFADLTYAKCENEIREPPEFQISVLYVLCFVVHLELVSCPLEAYSLEEKAAEHGSSKAVWKHSIYLHLRHLLYSLQVLRMKLFCGCTSWRVGNDFPPFISCRCITDDLYWQRWRLISLCGTRQKLQKCSSFGA